SSALPGESEAAGGDRRSDGRRAVLGDRHGSAQKAVSSHFKRLAAVEPQGAGTALRGAVPDRDHPGGDPGAAGDLVVADALQEIPVSIRVANAINDGSLLSSHGVCT